MQWISIPVKMSIKMSYVYFRNKERRKKDKKQKQKNKKTKHFYTK